jgi:hypothetical protein
MHIDVCMWTRALERYWENFSQNVVVMKGFRLLPFCFVFTL